MTLFVFFVSDIPIGGEGREPNIAPPVASLPPLPPRKAGARSSSIIRFNHRQRGTHLGDEQIKKGKK